MQKMSPLESIQPAHATQGGVERQQHVIRHQAEIDQQHLQEANKRKNAEKKDKTQETKDTDTDKAIINENEQQRKKRKKKQGKEKEDTKKLVVLSANNETEEIHHIDVKI